MAGLNEKQRAFCHEFMGNGGNATKAYEAAYGRGNNSDATLRTLGARTMKLDHVKAYLDELRAPAKEAKQHTVSSLADKLEKVYDAAMQGGQYSAAQSAVMGIAKLLGLDKGNGGSDDDDAQPVSVTVTVRDARVSRPDT